MSEFLASVVLFGCGLLYALGLIRWRPGRRALSWPPIAFGASWLALAVELLSPLHGLSFELFSVHMTQHALIMLVAAPFMVISRPLALMLWALPRRPRVALCRYAKTGALARVWRAWTAPFAAWLVHGAVLWIWHLPAFYEAALRSEAVHALEHASFFAAAAVFWWALLYGRYGRMGYGVSVAYLFTTAVHSGLLGALLTFAARPWYPMYEEPAAAWALTAMEDQQIGALLMWVPGGFVFMLAGLGLFAAWLREAERRVPL